MLATDMSGRVVRPQHCGNTEIHETHTYDESRWTVHVCTGQKQVQMPEVMQRHLGIWREGEEGL